MSDMEIYLHSTSDCDILGRFMSESSLSEAIHRLQSQVAGLSRRQQAAFFAGCAEGLLPLYCSNAPTAEEHIQMLRGVVGVAWSFVEGGTALLQSTEILANLEKTMPNERVEAPQSTFAQDAVICLDAAIRAASTNEKVDPAWIQYALEPITMMVCQEETGFYDLGSSASAAEWDKKALDNPRLLKAITCCTQMLDYISKRQLFVASDAQRLAQMSSDLA